MANGDKAAAAGLHVFTGTQDRRLGYDNDNIRGDELAEHMTNGGHPFTKITGTAQIAQGGTGATTASAALNNLGVPAYVLSQLNALPKSVRNIYAGAIALDYSNPTGEVKALIDATYITLARDDQVWKPGNAIDTGNGGLRSRGARYQGISSGYAAMYADGDGVFGIPGSSRAMKKALVEWTDAQADRFVSLVNAYWGLYLGDPDDGELRPFMILEEFEAAGFGAFVIRDEDGQGIGLHYELVSVALTAVARRHEDRLTALESRVDALEVA